MIGSLRARLAKLEAARLPPRQVIVAAGSRELVVWGEVARLEAEGALVTIVFTGIVRGPLDPLPETEAAACDP